MASWRGWEGGGKVDGRFGLGERWRVGAVLWRCGIGGVGRGGCGVGRCWTRDGPVVCCEVHLRYLE